MYTRGKLLNIAFFSGADPSDSAEMRADFFGGDFLFGFVLGFFFIFFFLPKYIIIFQLFIC